MSSSITIYGVRVYKTDLAFIEATSLPSVHRRDADRANDPHETMNDD